MYFSWQYNAVNLDKLSSSMYCLCFSYEPKIFCNINNRLNKNITFLLYSFKGVISLKDIVDFLIFTLLDKLGE